MPSLIALLHDLQEVDTVLRGLRLELGELAKAAEVVRVQAAEVRAKANARRQEIADSDKRKRELEAKVRDEEEKTKNRRMRMQRIRNERELAALRHEIDLGRESSSLMEEELLTLMVAGETRGSDLAKLETELAAHEASLAEREFELEVRHDTLREQLEQTTQERASRAALVDALTLSRYESLFERRLGLAVVGIRQGDCAGCGLRLPPQLLTELHRASGVVICPSCHRMLWVQVTKPAPAEAKA